MKIDELIEKTARKVIEEARTQNILKDNKRNSFQKTERILYSFNDFKNVSENYQLDDMTITSEFVRLVENAITQLSDEPYFNIIKMKYFEHKTYEEIGAYYYVNPATICKQRVKLINKLRPILFSNDFIKELYETI